MRKFKLLVLVAVTLITSSVYGDEIVNRYGQIQGYMKTDPKGNTNFTNKYGQYQGKVTEKGIILNKYGQEVGRIKKGR